MRKIINSTYITLDGAIEGPHRPPAQFELTGSRTLPNGIIIVNYEYKRAT